MKYRPDIEEVINRYKRFYLPGKGKILIHVQLPIQGGNQSPRLDEIDFATQNEEYLDRCVSIFESSLEPRMDIQDDFIPSFYAQYGIAQQSVFIAGSPVFGKDTSWVFPVINNWSDLNNLKVDEKNLWFKIMSEANHILVHKAKSKFAICPFLSYSPMDMANVLRGQNLFTDFYENEDMVHKLLNFCTNAIIWFEEAQKKIVGNEYGGLTVWGVWVPGRVVFLSEDVVNLCSLKIYDRFEKKYTQKIIDHFGGAYIHTHSLGLHDIPEICKLKNLNLLQIAEDSKQTRPIDELERLIKEANGVPLIINCTPQELKSNIDIARYGRVIFTTIADNVKEANDLVDFVRRNSRI